MREREKDRWRVKEIEKQDKDNEILRVRIIEAKPKYKFLNIF